MRRMKRKFKTINIVAVMLVLLLTALCFVGCEYSRDGSEKWKKKFDTTSPKLTGAGSGIDNANADGWYATFIDDFDSPSSLWAPSPQGVRQGGFWCDEMVEYTDGNAVINAQKLENHNHVNCSENGLFTSGIETRVMKDGVSVTSFEQAFGYFECRVLLPKSGGMWSAFWLQTNSISQLGNDGKDGSEIDIYESSFFNTNQSNMGHAIHYDGYGAKHKCRDTIRPAGANLYEGYHTFALKWTPDEYVFYIDGIASWASNFGGVCAVPAFLRLTCEIKNNTTGPYGQRLGKFDGAPFKIDYVKVFQNSNYLPFIKDAENFK